MELRTRKKIDYSVFTDPKNIIIPCSEVKKKQPPKKIAKLILKTYIPNPQKDYFAPSRFRLYTEFYMRDKQLPEVGESEISESASVAWDSLSGFRSITHINFDPICRVYSVKVSQPNVEEITTPWEYVVERYKSYGRSDYKEVADLITYVLSNIVNLQKVIKILVDKMKQETSSIIEDSKAFANMASPEESMPLDIPTYMVVLKEVELSNGSLDTSHTSYHCNEKLAQLLGYTHEEFLKYLIKKGIPLRLANNNDVEFYVTMLRAFQVLSMCRSPTEEQNLKFPLILVDRYGKKIPVDAYLVRMHPCLFLSYLQVRLIPKPDEYYI